MNFKYCYKNEIHKSFKIPPTLEALIQDITASFKTKLPPNFNIRYKDMDGDFITISSDVEYHSMLKFDTPANTRTSFKLFIVSPRDNATDEKEPSFEVIDSGNNTSQGGISEFSLTSKDCEEIPTERPSTSSQKDDNNTSTTERDRAPANSLQRSRVLNDTSDWKDEQLSFPDGEEESVSFGDETFNHAYKPVVSSPRQELVSPSLSGDSDMKVSLGREQQENSLEKIFDKMQPLDCRSIDFKEEEVNRPQSKENSIVLREIDNFMDKLVEQKKEMVPGSSDAAEIKPMFNAQRIMPLDLFDRRRREKIMKIKNRSARIIQRAFRTHQLQKEFDKFRMEHHVSTQEAVVGLTNLIKARLQALIEAQLPIQPVHQTFEPTHITPQEVSFERRRMPWEPETTEPHCYSFEKSATEERCMEEASLPHISRDCLICGDLRYCEHITDNDNNNNDDDEGYYRACSDNNLSLHDSRVESPYLDDLLNQSNSQVVEDTRLELPVIESKPVQSFGYRVMLGMSSSLLFLGGEEGQGVVYKTIYLENTGPKPWRKCYVKSVGLIEGKTLEFYNVDVGEISLVTLELNGYFTAGTYSSQWRLIHENEHGMMEPIGDAFEIEFMIESQNIINTLESLLPRKFTEEYPSQDFIYKYLAHDEEEDEATERYRDSFRDRTEDQEEEPQEEQEEMQEEEEEQEEYEDEDEDDEEYEEEEEEEEEEQYEDEDEDEEEEYYDEEEEYEEEEEEEYEDEEEEEYEEEEEEEEYEEREEDREKEERFKKYIDYKDEIYKIREMRKIFPLESLDELIEFVDNRPQLTVEELLIGYLAMKNKY